MSTESDLFALPSPSILTWRRGAWTLRLVCWGYDVSACWVLAGRAWPAKVGEA